MREDARTRIATRTRLWKEQNQCCAYCKRKIRIEQASLDHIIPVDALDRNLGMENLIVTCKWCNINKGNHIVYSLLFDREVYVMVDIPYFFQYRYITSTKKIRKN